MCKSSPIIRKSENFYIYAVAVSRFCNGIIFNQDKTKLLSQYFAKFPKKFPLLPQE